MRRRALLAVSAVSGGGEDTPFYAEFFFDYCEEEFIYVYCYRAPDLLGQQCYEKAQELRKYGIGDDSWASLTNPIDYGFEVYIEGELCTSIFWEMGTMFLNTDGTYEYIQILNDGTIQCEYETIL